VTFLWVCLCDEVKAQYKPMAKAFGLATRPGHKQYGQPVGDSG